MDTITKDGLVNRMHAAAYDPLMHYIEQNELAERRKHLLAPLTGKILEIGSGTGANFGYYNNSAQVIGCEPSKAMFEKAQKKVNEEKYSAQIHLLNMGIESDRIFKMISSSSLDAVVCTLVLCSVPNSKWVLKQIRQWLKPNGKLILLEHIRAHNILSATIQDIATPLWHLCSDGCNLNRSTDKDAKEAGFTVIKEEYFDFALPWYQAELQPS